MSKPLYTHTHLHVTWPKAKKYSEGKFKRTFEDTSLQNLLLSLLHVVLTGLCSDLEELAVLFVELE